MFADIPPCYTHEKGFEMSDPASPKKKLRKKKAWAQTVQEKIDEFNAKLAAGDETLLETLRGMKNEKPGRPVFEQDAFAAKRSIATPAPFFSRFD